MGTMYPLMDRKAASKPMTQQIEVVEQGELDKPLTREEATQLRNLERKITHGLATFVEVGNALEEIKESKLYRSGYSTFDAYCKDKWGMGRSYADRLVEAAVVATNLLPIGGKKPTSEAVVRPLVALKPEEQQEAWEEALSHADGGTPTARDVQAAVKTVAEKHAEPEARRSQSTTKALKHIGDVCGKHVVTAINDGSLDLSAADIAAWAGQKDDMMRKMQELVVGQRMSPDRVIKLLNRFPDGKTTVEEIINLAIANSGQFIMQIGGGKLTFKMEKER